MTQPSHITILRHGDTPLTGLFCGSSDPELTEAGWTDLTNRTKDRNWDRIITSPLKRCRAFAESLSLPLTLDDRLREMHFGEWEAKSTKEVWNADSQALKAFWEDPTAHPAPGGEPWDLFCARTADAFEEIALTAKSERLLLVTHAGVMRSLLVTQLGLPFTSAWKVALPTASALELTIHHGEGGDTFDLQLTALRGEP